MKHILVVEDEQHLAIGIKYNLEAEGYHATVVDNGPEALRVIQEGDTPVDLVVLDLMLPGMSGYAVCETLRSTGYDMPVLILSARTLPEDRTRGFEAGADQYLMKPFDLDEFLTRIRNLLALYERRAEPGSRPALRSAEFQFGDARINFETFEVSVRGEPLRMTQLEMRLLQYFVENEGRVIPRQELLEKVWGLRGRLNTRAPDQFIRRLRKSFEADPANPRHFLTIRDAGYRFVAAGVELPI
jgi:two-component system OmpR family response regulator